MVLDDLTVDELPSV